jgi:glutaminyl-tRNA synthetase
LPTLSGLRRRGYTPESIVRFCRRVGVTKVESVTDIALLEHGIRDELNRTAPRVMGVLDPVKLVIDNYPADRTETLQAVNNPEDPAAGTRAVPFSGEVFVERDDFMEDAPRKFYRLTPGQEVRLRYAYLVTCTGVEKDADGNVQVIHCTYDPDSRGGDAPDGRRVRGTIHWVDARSAVEVDARLYDRLFSVEKPDDVPEGGDFKDNLNPDSLRVLKARVEPAAAGTGPGARLQFERRGYFYVDPADSMPGAPVFNRIVPLRDSWGRRAARG